MIYISASSVKSFLDCSQQYWYRKESSEEGETNADAEAGSVVHDLLENHWKESEPELQKLALFKLEKAGIEETRLQLKVAKCITNYSESFRGLLTDDDQKELSFKIKLNNQVTLVGRIDRIVTPYSMIIDWKTSSSVVNNIDKDIQFLLYYYAYTKLYNKPPSLVTYASLYHNKLVNLNINKEFYGILIDSVIPGMVEQISNNIYYKSGVFLGKCNRCQFNKVCLGK